MYLYITLHMMMWPPFSIFSYLSLLFVICLSGGSVLFGEDPFEVGICISMPGHVVSLFFIHRYGESVLRLFIHLLPLAPVMGCGWTGADPRCQQTSCRVHHGRVASIWSLFLQLKLTICWSRLDVMDLGLRLSMNHYVTNRTLLMLVGEKSMFFLDDNV